MILYIASVIIVVFVCFNLFFRADCGLAIKIAGCALALLASLKYEVYRFLGGFFFAPQLPRPLLLFFETIYGALLLLFFLLLLWDIYLAGNWILAKAGIPVPHKLPTGMIRCGLVCIALCLAVWGVYQAVKVPEPRSVEVKIASLPPGLDGATIAQLSDLHIGPILKKDWLAEVVARTNALNPDLILLTGDYVDGYAADIGHELAPLAGLKARYGVFAVTGNHEYYWNMPEWRRALENLGLKMLENEHRPIAINGETIALAGVPDLAAARFGLETPDFKKAFAGAPEAVRILLAHDPKIAVEAASEANLVLSGHTHGGMMFFLQPLIAHFNAGLVNGLYPVAGNNVYVSPGTGVWNGFSCRIGVPAEITRIVLRKM